MDINELRKLLSTDVVTVVFTKKDGSNREMICTTIPDYLPESTSSNISTAPSDSVVTVWDLEQNGWRSFRFDSVKSIDTDYFNYVVGS
jgi:hypothetical protein